MRPLLLFIAIHSVILVHSRSLGTVAFTTTHHSSVHQHADGNGSSQTSPCRLHAKRKSFKKQGVQSSPKSLGKGFGLTPSADLEDPSKGSIKNNIEINDVDASGFHAGLLSWLKQYPLTYISPKFSINPSELGGYGGFCSLKSGMQKDELIFRVPRECCVTFDDAFNDPVCGEAFRMIQQKRVPSWGMLVIAGWVAKEYLLANVYSEKIRSAGIKNAEQIDTTVASKIKHWPYYKTLPWKRGSLNQDHILFWSDEEVERLLKGSLASTDAQLIRSTVKNAVQLLNDFAVGPLVREERENQGLPILDNDDYDDDNANDGTLVDLKEAVTGAFVIALSRSFAEEVECDNEDGTTTIEVENALLPLLDVLQHSNNPNTILESYPDYILLKARRDIKPGEELFHQYQDENDQVIPPYKFFTRYGFVPGLNESVEDMLEKKDPLFFG